MGRKGQSKAANLAEKRPSEAAASSSRVPGKPLVELNISEEEQTRLIKQSGILDKAKEVKVKQNEEEYIEHRIPLAEEIFNAIIYIVPTSFLLLLMEILIHQQYRQQLAVQSLVDRMGSGVPILAIFVFYTLRYKSYRSMQLLLLSISVLSSSRMIYILNMESWLVNMQQAPPLATLWVYCVVQLDLLLSLVSLVGTGAFVWWKDLRLAF
ncbi:hypothetical protein FA15DRAFT_685140 [Coprinopsis marcescibilis]|uniref:DUF7719 domain-containing protein n=1 Tax=Coprinopsis marcescibilis TaxID=230819 RepID=A0A5C3L9Y1_COPMA|nr:hypothetical protein FA15DRAFT_685140 [Coprinopsis marcescibilis]